MCTNSKNISIRTIIPSRHCWLVAFDPSKRSGIAVRPAKDGAISISRAEYNPPLPLIFASPPFRSSGELS